jgi:hypothetical protein
MKHLDARDAALWVRDAFVKDAGGDLVAEVIKLPWRVVICDSDDCDLIERLEDKEDVGNPLVRRRGFVQLVDVNPSEVLLPPHCLPVYLLNGRGGVAATGGLAALTRRLTMLESLRRLQVRELLVLSGSGEPIPEELGQLWNDGLRTLITIVSDADGLDEKVSAWRAERPFGTSASYYPFRADRVCREIVSLYTSGIAEEKISLRIRGFRGEFQSVDVSKLDNVEHPLRANYDLLQEVDLRALLPDDLSSEEVRDFFQDSSLSWRPYAAGMPWRRDDRIISDFRSLLRRLDREGTAANRIAYISAEEGAGGTTLARMLAWWSASEGYPTLVARLTPFKRRSLEVTTFMARVVGLQRQIDGDRDAGHHYEAPWVIVFDRVHWDGRTDELRNFLRAFEHAGRPVCIVVVKGPYIDINMGREFVEIASLSHQISRESALELGLHLNSFLKTQGRVRTSSEWESFYSATALQSERGISAFWIALSFWVQRQFDFKETIQSWIYRQFKERVPDQELRNAIIIIAAICTEMRPLPEAMLPPTSGWPVSQRLEDVSKEVGALALARISREGDRYWLLAHSEIGRYLLNGLFYDPVGREQAGFAEAINPEHLRFLALRKLSKSPALSLIANREIAEDFAISIFKVDPDHGHAQLAPFWREVLQALDEMPSALRSSSRTVLHHSAISRRRIAKGRDMFPMDSRERIALLERAVVDIRYALERIPPTDDGEPDINLYNSLAHAYQDLADEEAKSGASRERIIHLRGLAHEATQRAYRENPTNSFVVETYARSLIGDAELNPDKMVENVLEVLNTVYLAMERDSAGQRHYNLGRLADQAIDLLLAGAPRAGRNEEPKNEIEALVAAVTALTSGVQRFEGMNLEDYPRNNRMAAEKVLGGELLQGNAQAARLRYALTCIDEPHHFKKQLELLQSLRDGDTVFGPQMRLELALLLQHCSRHHEAEKLFRDLRRVWHEGEYHAEVPDRLRWLLTPDGVSPQQVTAKVLPRDAYRQSVRVRELQDSVVPFRPQEFGQQEFRPGTTIRGLITFSHNGPFLRPPNARSA